MAGRLLLAVVVLMVARALPAFASSITSARASLTDLEIRVASQAGEIHQLTTAYQQATLQATTLREQLVTEHASLSSLRARVAVSRSDLRQVALRSYTAGQMTNGLSGVDQDVTVDSEYLAFATGDVDDTIDQLRLQQRQLGTVDAALRSEQTAEAAAVTAAATARDDAVATAGQEQAQLVVVQSHLQQLVTAQAVADARVPAATAPATQGVPVNNGLVSVVRTIVSAPPTTVGPANGAAPAPTSIPAAANAPIAAANPAGPISTPAAGAGLTATSQDLEELRQCESGGDYQENTGNGFYGAYQFSASTWSDLGYPGRPDQEPPAMQDQAAQQLEARNGWGQWPACAAALGL